MLKSDGFVSLLQHHNVDKKNIKVILLEKCFWVPAYCVWFKKTRNICIYGTNFSIQSLSLCFTFFAWCQASSQRTKMYWKLILKSSRFASFGDNLVNFKPGQSWKVNPGRNILGICGKKLLFIYFMKYTVYCGSRLILIEFHDATKMWLKFNF